MLGGIERWSSLPLTLTEKSHLKPLHLVETVGSDLTPEVKGRDCYKETPHTQLLLTMEV